MAWSRAIRIGPNRFCFQNVKAIGIFVCLMKPNRNGDTRNTSNLRHASHILSWPLLFNPIISGRSCDLKEP